MQVVYLSRRNLEVLLSKLDRKTNGETTQCTILKSDTVHPHYPCSDIIQVTAVENREYYKDRECGMIHPDDMKNLS